VVVEYLLGPPTSQCSGLAENFLLQQQQLQGTGGSPHEVSNLPLFK